MANLKKIQRNEKIEIRVSKEEKDLFNAYAEELSLMPTRLARAILMQEAEKNFFAKKFEKGVLKAYKKYAEVTNNEEILDRFKKHENAVDD